MINHVRSTVPFRRQLKAEMAKTGSKGVAHGGGQGKLFYLLQGLMDEHMKRLRVQLGAIKPARQCKRKCYVYHHDRRWIHVHVLVLVNAGIVVSARTPGGRRSQGGTGKAATSNGDGVLASLASKHGMYFVDVDFLPCRDPRPREFGSVSMANGRDSLQVWRCTPDTFRHQARQPTSGYGTF